MGRFLINAHHIINGAVFIVSALTALAYARWHYWWRSGFGRGGMALLAGIAGTAAGTALHYVAGIKTSGTAGLVLDWIGVIGLTVALSAMSYILICILTINLRQSGEIPASRTRRYLEHLPGATPMEIKELLTCWDTLQERHIELTQPHPSSR